MGQYTHWREPGKSLIVELFKASHERKDPVDLLKIGLPTPRELSNHGGVGWSVNQLLRGNEEGISPSDLTTDVVDILNPVMSYCIKKVRRGRNAASASDYEHLTQLQDGIRNFFNALPRSR